MKICGIIDKSGKDTYPTLAGTLIFGEYPQTFYPQLFIACAVIPGIELGDTGVNEERFTDNKRIEGTIEEMFEETMNFLQRNMKTRIIIDSEGKRVDRTEYPIKALREAVANALIHRDYSTQTENAYISVYMYNDRVEILNPGALYGTNKLEKLGTATIMESRNPTIVRILEEKSSVIENRHSGIPTMKREMRNYDLPEPEFYEERDSFKVIFRNKKTIIDQVSDQVLKYQQIVLEFCKIPKSTSEIMIELGLKSRRYVREKIIKPLIEKNLLEYTNKNHINASNQKYIISKKKGSKKI